MKAAVLAFAVTCVTVLPLSVVQAAAPQATAPLDMALKDRFSLSMADLGLAFLRDQPPSQNSMNSPYSVANALGMVLLGAAGESEKQLNRALSVGSAQPHGLARDMQETDAALNSNLAGITFRNANRMWLNAGLSRSILPSYSDMTRLYYKSDAVLQSFDNPDQAVRPINDWIEEKTSGQIANMLTPDQLPSSTQMVLVNAVYFKGLWRTRFSKERTVEKPFTLDDGQTLQVPTMHTVVNARTATQDGVRWLELPYRSESAQAEWVMQIALPRPGQSLAQLQQQLTGAQWLAAMQQLTAQQLEVELPRFSMKGASSSLRHTLNRLGVVDIFSARADLRNITGSPDLRVDDVFHRATIEVDEEGTVASAATVGMVTLSRAEVLPRFTVNRPFLFFLVHKPTKMPVFLGRVVNPAQGH